ncbi:nuclear transport factor 2 family protein [Nocardioides sp. CER19]|uniref:nuclear transport factor 2 family protein n=1 Tax=Nocardioides sp. CER19 TaxID=3038538 RepID=UPI00244757A5|nr:nuclear transport factor 2 family protein [Nocardioides sp. CER19]MDH2416491.1 nuclear transport factor 2 family protein [Nocardioides sp. CER19]
METPAAVQRMIEATNAGDHAAFVAAFTEDAYLEDWGRKFHGRDGVASWDHTDNIGKNTRFAALRTRQDGEGYVVTLDVRGDGFNGTSDIAFEVQGDQIRSMVIKPD